MAQELCSTSHWFVNHVLKLLTDSLMETRESDRRHMKLVIVLKKIKLIPKDFVYQWLTNGTAKEVLELNDIINRISVSWIQNSNEDSIPDLWILRLFNIIYIPGCTDFSVVLHSNEIANLITATEKNSI